MNIQQSERLVVAGAIGRLQGIRTVLEIEIEVGYKEYDKATMEGLTITIDNLEGLLERMHDATEIEEIR